MFSFLRRLRFQHGLILFVSFLLFLPVSREKFMALIIPLSAGVHRATRSALEFTQFVARLPGLYEERAALEAEMAELRRVSEDRLQLEQEVTALRALLELPDALRQTRVIGEVTGGLPGSVSRRLLVRTAQPIDPRPNQPVTAAGYAFGRVVGAQAGFLIVEPLARSREIRAVTLGPQAVTGLLHARAGTVSVEDIDPSAQIAIGDEVRIAEQDEVFAEGTLAGVVKRLESPPGSLVKRAIVQSPASPRDVRFVEVLP